MNQDNKNYCLILAGGVGSRLWPTSREKLPKQFIDFTGTGRTLIQQTYDRFARFISPDHIFVSTQEDYLPLLHEQLPQLPRAQVLSEPVRRGTLAPVAWGTSAITKLCPEARMVVSPADQEIYDETAFQEDILSALDMAGRNDGVITLCVKPTRPETAYGYVQAGDPMEGAERIYHVKTFTEKPNADFAKIFLESGEFYWNTGLFVFATQYMINNIIKHVPEYRDEFPEMADLSATATTDTVPRYYSALPNLSVEYAVLEHTGHNYMQHCRFGWADLGSWQGMCTDAIHTAGSNTPHPPTDIKVDGRGNVTVHSDALFDDASDNIVRLPSGHLAVISGLQGYAVTEEDNVLMICPKNDAAAMRRLQTLAHLDSL